MRHSERTRATNDVVIREAYQRIESLLDRAEKARQELNYVLGILPDWLVVYEDLSGEKFPDEILRAAGMIMPGRPKRRQKENVRAP